MSIYKNFPNHDRFKMPEGIFRVTAGMGGETFLIDGGGKTALYDTGMAYCSRKAINNIEKVLDDLGYKTLDKVFISHTHYDHLGALPYILNRWPDAKVYAAEKALSVFSSLGALKTMKRLGEAARNNFGDDNEKCEEILVDGLRVDHILHDGEELDLGKKKIISYYTPGHTNCSFSFMLIPDKVLFLSESTGVLRSSGVIHTAILKDFDDCIASSEKCRGLNANILISPHFGCVPEYYNERYFNEYEDACYREKKLILDSYNVKHSEEDAFNRYCEEFWSKDRERAQTWDAFSENAKYIVHHIISKFGEENETQDDN